MHAPLQFFDKPTVFLVLDGVIYVSLVDVAAVRGVSDVYMRRTFKGKTVMHKGHRYIELDLCNAYLESVATGKAGVKKHD